MSSMSYIGRHIVCCCDALVHTNASAQ